MKYCISAVVFFWLALYAPTTVVTADRMVRVLFNNGIDDGDICTVTDNLKIDAIIASSSVSATYNKRNLRSATSYTDHHNPGIVHEHRRELLYYPRYCKKSCAGYVATTCRATNCGGYRRRRALNETNRTLQSNGPFNCSRQVKYIETELNKLVENNLTSSSCTKLLAKPRNVTCYDDVIYGVVEYFKLWKTNTVPQTVVDSYYTGQSICRSAEFTFEAITNDCVDFLLTSIKGPNSYYRESGEYTRPFSVFGDSFITGGSFNGLKVPYLGRYNLTSLPDGLVEKAKVMTFNVVTGPVESLKLWDTVAKTIMNPNFTGGNICRRKEFAFEIVVNSCADSHRSTLTGPGYSKSMKEERRPFSIFGEAKGVFNGVTLSTVGEYTLTVYPDQEVSNMVKTIQFNITNC
jgi:hypothetical protein